ncbi:MAG: LamG domain-containing protein, partial [Cyanobium sp.]
FWIKIPTISTTNNQWCSIISKIQDNSKRTYAIWLYGGTNASTSDRGKILWQGWTSSTTANHNHNVVSTTSLSPNLWYHIAVTRQVNGLARIYINGAEENSAPFLGVPASTSSTPLKLGQSVLDLSSHIGFIGTIDELRIWNTVRSSQEISDFRTRQISTATPGLVLCYNFNQGTPSGSNASVTTVPDVSGSNFHGTLSGFALTGSTSNWVSAGFTLPVTWHSFNAEKLSNKVLLDWVTSSELNTKDFEVLHSTNAVSWSKIGTVVAAGNSNQQRSYSFTHLSPLKNSIYNYYRIKQNDLDEQNSFSKIISIFTTNRGLT